MKKVAVIQDISGFGRCSLTAALPVLSCMGIQVCPVPTAVLTGQTGYPDYRMQDCGRMIGACIDRWSAQGVELDAIYTGFLASGLQGRQVHRFVRAFRRPGTLLLVDPVLGDHGELYPTADEAVVRQMRLLVRQADVITPNLTEACLLADVPYAAVDAAQPRALRMRRIREIGRRLMTPSRQLVVITGIMADHRGSRAVGNLVCMPAGEQMVWTKASGGSYSGTGDLFASALLGGLLCQQDPVKAVRRAARMIEKAAERSFAAGTDPREGVAFETFLKTL
ncbi:MAG: pyridoxamine kinase [Clostridia bacterium]|nr:pyridoxamine kinase [Clostridia bacterium]